MSPRVEVYVPSERVDDLRAALGDVEGAYVLAVGGVKEKDLLLTEKNAGLVKHMTSLLASMGRDRPLDEHQRVLAGYAHLLGRVRAISQGCNYDVGEFESCCLALEDLPELESFFKSLFSAYWNQTPEIAVRIQDEKQMILWRGGRRCFRPNQSTVLIERYGLVDGKQKSLAAVARIFDRTVDRVRSIEMKALWMLSSQARGAVDKLSRYF